MYRFLVLVLVLSACRTVKETVPPEHTEPVLSFLVLTISREDGKQQTVLQLVSRTEAAGTMKKPLTDNIRTAYYLKVYAYSGKQVVDSVKIEHPLYKHFEYRDDDGHFAVKDTVVGTSEFFVRFQATSPITELKALEFTRNETTGKWVTLKL